MALNVGSLSYSQEDYGIYALYGLPLGEPKAILAEMDAEITKLQLELISERDMEKLQNKIMNEYVNKYATIEGTAESLATYYLLFGDVNLVNTDIDSTKASHARKSVR
jgi:predicted Zn-dependent peptidase